MKKSILLLTLLSATAFADCQSEFFKNLKAENTDKAYQLLYTKCTSFYVKNEFGKEENIYQEFQKVSKPFLLKFAECQKLHQSSNPTENLNLKQCLDMRAVRFYEKRLGNPIKDIIDGWRTKYNQAKKKESEKPVLDIEI